MNAENKTTVLSRNVRFVWLIALILTPGVAFATYELTPHEEIWHEVLYSLFCVPLFVFWMVALLACVLSFLLHRTLSNA